MTARKDSSLVVENSTPIETSRPKTQQTYNIIRRGVLLRTLALAIVISVLYFYGKQQIASVRQALATQLSNFQQQSIIDRQYLVKQLEKQARAIDIAHQQLYELKQKVAIISSSDVQNWLLVQADFLVKMANRKIWSDYDIATATVLLKSADASLADMRDSSLIEARRALDQDISMLSALSQTDYDGIILKLHQLSSNGIDNLRMADKVNYNDDASMDGDRDMLSASHHEWRHNLIKSWHNFMDDFITIRHRNALIEPLLVPNQKTYLRENIRSQLLIAAQSVSRHQNKIYKKSIDIVSAWIRTWYDINDPITKNFLSQLDELSQKNISMNMPVVLQSQPLLEKLMQTRVHNRLTQPFTNSDDHHSKENNHDKSFYYFSVSDSRNSDRPNDCRPPRLCTHSDR